MKKILLAALALMLLATAGWSKSRDDDEEEEAPQRYGSVNIFLIDSLAPLGLSGELYLGNLGIGASFSFLTFGMNGYNLLTYEPGAFAHLYIGKIQNSIYLGVSTTYWTALGSKDNTTENLPFGVWNVNGVIGFNTFTGDDDGGRFYIEIGPRYSKLVGAEGTDTSTWLVTQGLGFHLQLGYGVNF